ncbi:hypothetical protein [Nocardia amamiensis]|uniref:hypothetical protein n=1 Tax=Nocardia amamiensis TaxID=404578 RepID=UPI003F53F403
MPKAGRLSLIHSHPSRWAYVRRDDLDAPIARVCTDEVPILYARQLQEAALPRSEAIVEAVLEAVS